MDLDKQSEVDNDGKTKYLTDSNTLCHILSIYGLDSLLFSFLHLFEINPLVRSCYLLSIAHFNIQLSIEDHHSVNYIKWKHFIDRWLPSYYQRYRYRYCLRLLSALSLSESLSDSLFRSALPSPPQTELLSLDTSTLGLAAPADLSTIGRKIFDSSLLPCSNCSMSEFFTLKFPSTLNVLFSQDNDSFRFRPNYSDSIRRLRIRAFNHVDSLDNFEYYAPFVKSISLYGFFDGELPASSTLSSAPALSASNSFTSPIRRFYFASDNNHHSGLPFLPLHNNNLSTNGLPSALQRLEITLSDHYEIPFKGLPVQLKQLKFKSRFSRKWINEMELKFPEQLQSLHLPKGIYAINFTGFPHITQLYLPEDFKGKILPNSLPPLLQILDVGYKFDQPFEQDTLPQSITHLFAPNVDLCKFQSKFLPQQLKLLSIKANSLIVANTLPVSLNSLELGGTAQLEVNSFPYGLVNLKLRSDFDSITLLLPNVLPPGLECLLFARSFKKSHSHQSDVLPNCFPTSLTRLDFEYNGPLASVLPDSLTYLNIFYYNQPFDNTSDISFELPRSLVHLEFHYGFNQPLFPNILPSQLTFLRLSDQFNQALQPFMLPESLITCHFGAAFNQLIPQNVFGNNLTRLSFGENYNQQFDENILPNSLTVLDLSKTHLKNCFGSYPLPPNLTTLLLPDSFIQSFEPFHLPSCLTLLSFRGPSRLHNELEFKKLNVGSMNFRQCAVQQMSSKFQLSQLISGAVILPTVMNEIVVEADNSSNENAYVLPFNIFPPYLLKLCLQGNIMIPVDVLPPTLTSLTLSDGYHSTIQSNTLPNSLMSLFFKNCPFNYAFTKGILPAFLEELSFLDCQFNQNFFVHSLPNSLKYLSISNTAIANTSTSAAADSFNQALTFLPSSLTHLTIRSPLFNSSLQLPSDSMLKYLTIESPSFDQPLPHLPVSLRYFCLFVRRYSHLLHNVLPEQLVELQLDGDFSAVQIIGSELPIRLKYLGLGFKFSIGNGSVQRVQLEKQASERGITLMVRIAAT